MYGTPITVFEFERSGIKAPELPKKRAYNSLSREVVLAAIDDTWRRTKEIHEERVKGSNKWSVMRALEDLVDIGLVEKREVVTGVGGGLAYEWRLPPEGYIPPLYPESRTDARPLAACWGGFTYPRMAA